MNHEAIEGEVFFQELDTAYQQPGHLMRRKMMLVKSLVVPSRRLLDVGCGTGEALTQLRTGFEQVVGLDASASAMRWARQRNGIDDGVALLQGNASQLCFGSETFDCCLLLDVLEHLQEPELALLQVANALKRDGQLIVTVPNWTDWITSRLLRLNPNHRGFHTPGGWRRLIDNCGFQTSYCRAVRLPILQIDAWATKLPWLGMCILLVAERQ